jgi:hypothetical protein
MISHAPETIARPSTRRIASTASSAAGPPARRIAWPVTDVIKATIAKPIASMCSP